MYLVFGSGVCAAGQPQRFSCRSSFNGVVCRGISLAQRGYVLADLLRVWVFRLPDAPAKMLRRDLEAAGIPYKDSAGRYADFHSLRHTTLVAIGTVCHGMTCPKPGDCKTAIPSLQYRRVIGSDGRQRGAGRAQRPVSGPHGACVGWRFRVVLILPHVGPPGAIERKVLRGA